MEIHVVPVILDLDQLRHHFIPVLDHARAQGDHHVLIVHRVSQTVDTGYTGNDDDIAAFGQRHGGGETELVDLIVDGGVLGDVGIRGGDVGFGLVVVIVGDKVFNRIVREELFEFTIQLRCECLIMGNDQCRLVQLRYHICHRKCLSRSRNP